MSNLRISIGGDGPVVAQSDATGWRLIVRGRVHATGADNDELHVALRDVALSDRDLAGDAFAVVVNCMGSWEDEYTEVHDEARSRSRTGWSASNPVSVRRSMRTATCSTGR